MLINREHHALSREQHTTSLVTIVFALVILSRILKLTGLSCSLWEVIHSADFPFKIFSDSLWKSSKVMAGLWPSAGIVLLVVQPWGKRDGETKNK